MKQTQASHPKQINAPKAILFDLDDTLLSFGSSGKNIWKQCCEELIQQEKLSIELTPFLQTLFSVRDVYWSDPVRHKRGREDLKMARREIVEQTFDALHFENIRLAHKLADRYTSMHEKSLHLYPGTHSTLEYILSKQIKMALITNGSSLAQRSKLSRFELAQYFDAILIDQEFGKSKPHPQIFEAALISLSVGSEDAWMVGDNLLWDISGAQSLGIYSIWANYDKKPPREDSPTTPDHTIYSIEQLVELLP